MNVEKGIKQLGNKYVVYIDLTPIQTGREKTYSFHIGTLNTLEEARDIRRKAEEIVRFCGKRALEPLEELKKQIADNRMTKKKAANILKEMLYEHRLNSNFIAWDSDYDDDIRHKEDWKAKEKALEIAIKCLER